MENLKMSSHSINVMYDYTTASVNSTSKDNCSVPSQDQMFRLVAHIMVCLLGIIGNAVVIWFCSFRMKKTVTVVWILNLAVADFLFTFFLPMRISYFALENDWKFGDFMCKSFWFINYLNLSVSVFQLMVISVDRYICVHFPVWCKNRRRLRLAIIIVTIIWIVSILFNVPYFILKSTFHSEGRTCCSNSKDEKFKGVAIARFVCLFIVPFTIIVLCYAAITKQIKRKGMVSSSRPFKIFVAIIFSFFVCFFPYNLFLLLQLNTVKNPVIRNVKLIVMCLVIAHSCINPIIYIIIGRDFKERFCTSIQSVFEKAFAEDAEQINSREQQSRENDMNSNDAYQVSSTAFTEFTE